MKEILINTIYNDNSTAYANEGENIVHEIINLFKAENNKHYIYIVSDGSISYEHNDKISDIFLTRSVGNKTAEIIALVKSPKQLVRKERNCSKSDNMKKMFEKQKEYIEQIRYDKKRKIRVDEIFKHNTYHNEVQENVIYATFEADIVLKPKRPIFLTFSKENTDKPNTYFINKQFINQSQICYIEEKSNVIDFKTVQNLIDSKELWEDSFKKVDVDEYTKEKEKKENHDNFLKLIHHEYYEPAFSNLFQHYFNQNLDIFKEFAKEVLGIELNTECDDFEIKREEHNIDILIRDSSNVIVIENKIKSGINGKKYDDYGETIQDQLVKYYKYVIEGTSKKIKNTKDPRYYDKNKKAHFFIFAPDYKHLDKSKFKEAKEYNIIEYSKIYNFYKKYTKDGEKYFDKYFIDFVNAMYKHTLLVDSEIYDVMLERFITAIKKASN